MILYKKYITLISKCFKLSFILLAFPLSAQTTDLVTGISTPEGFVLNGNELYYSVFNDNKISKIEDITQSTITSVDVVSGLNGPIGLALVGNELYIVERNGNKVSKIDITDTSPSAVDVVTGLGDPAGILINGTDMYISEINTNKISLVDLSSGTPTATDFIATGLEGPVGMALVGNDLYIAERDGDVVSKADISAPVLIDVVSTGITGPRGLAFSASENAMYISERDGDKISQIDVTAPTPITPVEIINTVQGPTDIVLDGSELYIGEFSKISKSDLNTLSVSDNLDIEFITLYPNPCNDFLRIEGDVNKFLNKPFSVFNMFGQEVLSGTLGSDAVIDLRQIKTGLYFLKINQEKTYKITKRSL